MLRHRALTAALNLVQSGHVQSVMLFNQEGVLISHTGFLGDDEGSKAAIISDVWNLYQSQPGTSQAESVQEMMMEFSSGRLIVARVASTFLLCIRATHEAPWGMLRAKMTALVERLHQPLTCITAN